MEGFAQPVIIDNGTGIIKAGLAGTATPKCSFPNYVGVPKHLRVMSGELNGEIFAGAKAEQHRGVLTIRYPMEFGSVVNWNDMESVWDHLYSREQLNVARDEHPVLLTEVPFETFASREKAAEIFFESFNVPGLYFSMQAVLSLYATGRTTGVVCDSGEGVTQAVPVYQGFAIPHCMNRIDIAGREVTKFLKNLLRDEHNSANCVLTELEVVKDIKEKTCFVRAEEEDNQSHGSVKYVLPDGVKLEVGSPRYRAPEVLFRPHLIGDESLGIHELLSEAIGLADMDLRRTLFQNIVISGGTSLLPGFSVRVLNELKKKAPKDVKVKLSVPKERLYSAWIGGSILASLESFHNNMMVTKKEYDDHGPGIFR
uniref:Beta-centractin n=1 Tax=Lygus hesperus TaxID=30085 RepID=A0A0A9WI68_LYGHE